MRNRFPIPWRLAALALAALLSACGGSDDNPLDINTVTVVGDSLSDSGTFAGLPGMSRTFTVQGTSAEPYVLWVERIAQAYKLAPLCPVYKFNGTTFAPNSQAGCTNHAIGGGRINNPASAGGTGSPVSVLRQLKDAAAAGWSATELLVLDGGGNDAADLVGAYLGAASDQGAAYRALLGTLLPAATLDAVLAAPNGLENAGGLYMQALADSLAGAIRADALGKGARQVVAANIPTITFTPRFQAVLDQIGASAGAAARAQSEALFRGWINAYNQRLASQFASEPRVKVVDVAARFNDFMARPQNYGLTNVTLPVCGAEWITVVPLRSFAQCTAAALTATPPPPGAPSGGGWWERYLFADSFHPTPYGHQLMADQVLDLLDDADWL